MRGKTKLLVAAAIAAVLVIAPAVFLWTRMDHSTPVIERMFDPRLLYSEVDGTLAIPFPTEFRSKTNFGILKSRFTYRISHQISPPMPGATKLPGVYYGRVAGRTNAYAFVYPPDPLPFEWQVLLHGEYVELLSLGSLNVLIRSNAYLWRSPRFHRTDGYTREFKRAAPGIRPETELYMRHGESDFGMIGKVTGSLGERLTTRDTNKSVEIEFIHGARESVPANTLTNYFTNR